MGRPCRGSPPVCLVQRLPLFVESLFEFVWEGSGGGLCWSWCVRRRMGNSLPTSMTHVCCDLCRLCMAFACGWSVQRRTGSRLRRTDLRSRRRSEFASHLICAWLFTPRTSRVTVTHDVLDTRPTDQLEIHL